MVIWIWVLGTTLNCIHLLPCRCAFLGKGYAHCRYLWIPCCHAEVPFQAKARSTANNCGWRQQGHAAIKRTLPKFKTFKWIQGSMGGTPQSTSRAALPAYNRKKSRNCLLGTRAMFRSARKFGKSGTRLCVQSV